MRKSSSMLQVMPERGGEGAISNLISSLIKAIGEDPTRDGLLKTPERVEKALRFLTEGYHTNIERVVNGALFDVEYDEMVMVRDIEFFSLCEHHILPFFGKMHVAYIPGKKVIGLSKIPRIVDVFSRRLQVQERLTQQVAQCLMDVLKPKGVAVVCEARHFCMMMRGVEKQHSGAVTSAMLGEFRENRASREEFLSLAGHQTLRF